MEGDYNNLPELSMVEVTRKLFNQQCLSDLQFRIQGQIIYAHSFELSKRSRVFHEQFKSNLGENKLILIDRFSYNSFYQFVRFIYTDECDITTENAMELFNLAVQYKVITLENRLSDFIDGDDLNLALLEFCIMKKYKLQYNRIKEIVAKNLSSCFKTNRFITIHPDVLEEIFKFDCANATELEILTAFLRWMEYYCQQQNIKRDERREHLDKYIRLIRFPTMSITEFRNHSTVISELLTNEDYAIVFKHILNGEPIPKDFWNSNPRKRYTSPYVNQNYFTKTIDTVFSVSAPCLLTGLRYGNNVVPTVHKIQIFGPNKSEIIQFKTGTKKTHGSKVVNLGESIRLKAGDVYTVKISYLRQSVFEIILCRNAFQNTLTHGCDGSILKFEPGLNMIEMFFQPDQAINDENKDDGKLNGLSFIPSAC